jgi:hypothetical protein
VSRTDGGSSASPAHAQPSGSGSDHRLAYGPRAAILARRTGTLVAPTSEGQIRTRHRPRRSWLLYTGLAGGLLLAGCEQEPATDPLEVEEEERDPPEEPEGPEDTADTDDAVDRDDADDTDEAAVEPLSGEPTTEDREDAGEVGRLAVTGVELATHDGFDRVVLHVEGEGTPGWAIRFEEGPIADPSGEPMSVEGEAFLRVAIRNVALPPDLPEQLRERVWDEERVAAPDDGGVVREVVADAIAGGQHGFYVGIDTLRPYLVERFEQEEGSYRVVIDVFHEEPDPAPLAGDPSTEPREEAGEPDTQFVHDVRVGTHDGFDRVVVEHSGRTPVGWRTAYVDDARAREVLGVEEPGEVVLEITIRNITPPDQLSDELQTWDEGPIDGPPGGVIEQVDAAIAEDHHVIVVGLPEELGYLVEYVDEHPGRLIVDIFHP